MISIQAGQSPPSVALFVVDGAPSVPPSDATASTLFDVASISGACTTSLAEKLS